MSDGYQPCLSNQNRNNKIFRSCYKYDCAEGKTCIKLLVRVYRLEFGKVMDGQDHQLGCDEERRGTILIVSDAKEGEGGDIWIGSLLRHKSLGSQRSLKQEIYT